MALPANHSVGQSGHVADHNLIESTLNAVKTTADAAQPASTLDSTVASKVTTSGTQTQSALNSNYVARSKVKADGTDQTATLQAELQALYNAGGGTLVLPSGEIRLDGQIVFPNDGGTTMPTGAQLQPSMTLRGEGGWHSGQVQSTSPDIGGTSLLCNYTDATYNNAKFVTRGLGRLTIERLTMRSAAAADSTPFLYTTNTTLHIRGCSFRGAAATQGACAIDAIVLGGTKKKAAGNDVGYGDADSAFQGYGTVIEGCYFDKVRRVAYGRSYANHIVIRDNFVEKTCGTNITDGACIEFNGNLDVANGSVQPGDYCTGNQIINNYLNGQGYYYQVKLTQATRCVVFGNGSPDPQANLASLVGCFKGTEAGTDYPATLNQIYGNHCQQSVHLTEDAASTGLNNLIGGTVAEGTKFRGNFAIEPGSQNPAQIGKCNFTDAITTSSSSTHDWGITSPFSAAGAPWRVRGASIDWLTLSNGSAPAWTMAGRLWLQGNTTAPAGSTSLTVGNNSTASDSEVVLNPPTGNSATVKFQYAGTNRWQIYNGAGASSLYVRDMTAATMALTFTTGTGNAGRADFIGAVNAGSWVKSQAVATASRPAASTAGAGAMVYDTTLSKPIWSDGTNWRDAAGTVV